MANVTANVSQVNVSVTATPSVVNVSQDGNIISNVNISTTNVTVGSTDLVVNVSPLAAVGNSTIRNAISVTDTGGDGSLTYSNVTGIITYTGPNTAEVAAHLSVVDAGGDGNLSYDNTTGVFTFTGPDQTEANARIAAAPTQVRAHLSNTSPITYDSATGVIGLEQTLDDLTLVKYQETVIDNGAQNGNISANITLGTVHQYELNGDVTGITLDNISAGGSATLFLTQDATGGIVLDTTTYPTNWTNWKFTNGYTDLSTGNGDWNAINVFYDGVDYYATLITQTGTIVQNSDLAFDSVTYNGETVSLGGSGNIDTFNTDVTVNSNILVDGTSNITGIADFGSNIDVASHVNITGNIYKQGSDALVVDPGNSGTVQLRNIDLLDFVAGNANLNLGTDVNGTSHLTSVGGMVIRPATSQSFTAGANALVIKTSVFGYPTPGVLNVLPAMAIREGGGITMDINPFGREAFYDTALKVTNGNANSTVLHVDWDGKTTFADAFTFPNTDGTADQVLKTYGNGTVRWATDSSLTNAQVQAYIEANGLDATANIVTTANMSANHGTFSSANITTATIPTLQGNTQINGELTVQGNVEVAGNLNYRNVEDLYVRDQSIYLNANATTDADIFIVANRPQSSFDAHITWNETLDKWQIFDGTSTYTLPRTTDDLTEGSTNLYYTDGRFDTRFATKTTDDLTEGTTNLYYSNALVGAYLPTYTGNLDSVGNLTVSGIIKTDDLQPVGGDPIAITSARVDDFQISQTGGSFGYAFAQGTSSANDFLIADGTGVFSPTAANTSIIAEGTNLYYTDARVDTHLNTGTASAGEVLSWTGSDYDWVVQGGYGNADVANFLANGFGSNSILTTGNITADYFIATEEFIGDIEGAISEKVYNNSGAILSKGAAVYVNGAQGDQPNVALANSEVASQMPAMGIVKEDIAISGTGQVVIAGTMNFSSHGFPIGSSLWVNGAGALTDTKPTGESNLIQKIAKVIGTNHILVQGAGRSNETPNLNEGNLFIGDSSNAAVTVAPSTNFVTSAVTTTTSNTAVSFVIGQGNAGHASDIWALTGHSSQIFADGTEIVGNSFTTSPLTGYNGNTYYTKWNATESGYEIYTDSGLTSAVTIGGSSFYGSVTGQAQTSSTSSTPAFKLSNALTNVNSIATETGSDFTLTSDSKLQLQERIGYNDTITNVGNIAGKGYGLTSQSWNFANETFAYTGTDNIDAIFVSGSFTEGSNVFTVAGACTGKDILVDGNNPDTVNNTSLLTGTVANRFYYNFFLSGGPGYPLSNDAKVVSANTTAIVFDTVASANVTVANNQCFGILTGVEDSTTGLGISFLTSNDLTGSGQSNVILDAVLHTQDAYGYPITGPVVNDFDTFTFGTASDYTGDFANATVRSKSVYELNKGVLGAENGLVIGANTSMSNRGINDSITTYGINMMFDGTTDYNAEYGISANTLLPQILFKQYTNNTLQAATPGAGGPRLFFTSAYGDITTNPYTQYPRDGQELGRVTFWGSLGNLLAPSSVNPPALISAVAAEDWTASNKTNFYIASNSSGANNAEIFLAYEDGKLVLASGSDGTTHKDIVLAPALQNSGTGPDGTYTTEGTTFAKVGYANVSATSGAKLTVTHGSSISDQGDQVITLERSNISATANVTNNRDGITNFYGGLSGVDSFRFSSALTNFTDGTLVTIGDYTGSVGTYFNGNSYYAKGHPVYAYLNVYALYTDAAMTTPVVSGESTGAYGPDGFFTWNYSGGVTDRDYTFTLGAGSEDLVLSSNATTAVTFHSNTDVTFAGNITYTNQTDGTVTSVASGNGLSGGPITSSGTLTVDEAFDFNFTGNVSASNITLSKFQETVYNAGNVSGAVSFDVNNGSIQKATVTGDITSLGLSNDRAGTSVTLILTQGATTGTLTAGASWLWAGGTKTLSTTTGDVDIISAVSDGTNYYGSLTTGYVT